MYCPACGASNAAGVTSCTACATPLVEPVRAAPPPGPGPSQSSEIPSYMVQSILVTLFCCLPMGIMALISASKVSALQAGGDVGGAHRASQEAWKWVKRSLFAGIGIMVLYGLAMVVAGSH